MANAKLSKEYCVTPYRDERGRFVKRPETEAEAKVKQTKPAPTPPPPPPAPPRPKVFKRTSKKVVKKGVLKRRSNPVDYLIKPFIDRKIREYGIAERNHDYIKKQLFTAFVARYIQDPTNEQATYNNITWRIEEFLELYRESFELERRYNALKEPTGKRRKTTSVTVNKTLNRLLDDKVRIDSVIQEKKLNAEIIPDIPRRQKEPGRKISTNEAEREYLQNAIAYYKDLLDKFSRIKNGLIPTANYDKEFEQIIQTYENDIAGRLAFVEGQYIKTRPDRALVQRRKKKVIKLRSRKKEQGFPPAGISLEPKKTSFEFRYGTGVDPNEPWLIIDGSGLRERDPLPNITLEQWIKDKGGLSSTAKLVAITTGYSMLIVNDQITPKIRKVFSKAKDFRRSMSVSAVGSILKPGNTKPLTFVGFENIKTQVRNPVKSKSRKEPWVTEEKTIFRFQDAASKQYAVAVDKFCVFGWSDIATGAWSFRITEKDKSPIYVYRGETLIGIASQFIL